jgi:hypothetical protein
LPVYHTSAGVCRLGYSGGCTVEHEQIRGFPSRYAAARRRHHPFAGEIPPFGILRDGNIFLEADSANGLSGHHDDGAWKRSGLCRGDGIGTDQNLGVGFLASRKHKNQEGQGDYLKHRNPQYRMATDNAISSSACT